ncbi:MAG TPA: response regulator, partial [Halothiobacillaceae bacterium]|nr:response regulator [Halothiobacillaceae bacterium]
LLSVLHKGLTDYRTLMSGKRFWAFLKRALRDITDSDYALIGEVLTIKGKPELKIHAITDISWNEESRELMRSFVEGDTRLTNHQTLLGRTFAGGEVVISTDTPNDPRSSALPHGHPVLQNFMGVPIMDEGKVIGMYAIANSRAQISEDLAAWLQPFTATCALMIRLYRQMAERERIMDELARARDEQERASRAKTDFLSAMSHELRTPLNSIIGFSQLIRSSKRDHIPDRTRRQVEQIEKSGHHLLELINEVLELSRIESGKLHLSIEPVDVSAVITAAIETTEGMAEIANIQFITEQIEDCHAWVNADFTRLKQVIINLLSNAIKYNREDGRVFISCLEQHDDVIISVRDEGIGIAAENKDKIFQPFNRLGAEDSAIQGTGVGLSLTKQLIEAMNGEIGFNSVVGDGSTFWIRLPKAINSVSNAINAESPQPQKVTVKPTTAQATAASDAPSTTTVLYVEDNPANQRLMEDIFEDIEQTQLHIAADADTGLMLAQHLNPDLILMDLHLPGMDGYAALKALKANSKTQHIPVAAVSANALESDIKSGKRAGFVAYLTKPVDIDELTRLVASYQNKGADL